MILNQMGVYNFLRGDTVTTPDGSANANFSHFNMLNGNVSTYHEAYFFAQTQTLSTWDAARFAVYYHELTQLKGFPPVDVAWKNFTSNPIDSN